MRVLQRWPCFLLSAVCEGRLNNDRLGRGAHGARATEASDDTSSQETTKTTRTRGEHGGERNDAAHTQAYTTVDDLCSPQFLGRPQGLAESCAWLRVFVVAEKKRSEAKERRGRRCVALALLRAPPRCACVSAPSPCAPLLCLVRLVALLCWLLLAFGVQAKHGAAEEGKGGTQCTGAAARSGCGVRQ